MSWLNRAAGLGFFSDAKNREKARADNDLAALRNRADFAKLLAGESGGNRQNTVRLFPRFVSVLVPWY